MAEIIEAMKTLREPETNNNLITKNAFATVLGGVFLALGAWLMSGLNQMQQSVTQVQTTVVALQHSVDGLVQSNGASSDTQAGMKTDIARIQQRVDEDEQRLNQLDGRGTYGNVPQGPSPRSSP
jgi:outer membrane murein-binding lipoprotein Lpp